MIGTLKAGKLTGIDTKKGEICITDRTYEWVDCIDLDQKLKNWSDKDWIELIGCDVEVVVVDDIAVWVKDVTLEE